MDCYEFERQYDYLSYPRYDDSCKPSIDYLTDLVCEYNHDTLALGEIRKAYFFAKAMHDMSDHPKRDSGEPYIIHPLEVAIILAKMHADKDTICAGLLHDVIEDTETTELNLAQLFNKQIARYVEGVSKLEYSIDNNPYKLDNAAYMRKLICGVEENSEIFFIKIADKLHNMRTLSHKKPEKQVKTALETINTFAPLARLFGAYDVKNELEDLSLKYYDAEAYEIIINRVNTTLHLRKKEVLKVYRDLKYLLDALNFHNEISCSAKNIYGIYKTKYNDLDDMHDLISIQVLLDDSKKCYELNDLLCSLYNVNKNFSKDFIKNPKPNMYKSLHTTIYDEVGSMIQIEIRTFDMDKTAKYGYASCWDLSGPYAKENMQKGIKTNLTNPIHAISRMCPDDKDFLEQVKMELLKDNNIFVYTKDHKAIQLPFGASVIDLSCLLYINDGHKVDYAIVNGTRRGAFYILNDGDRIDDVILSDKVIPDVLWLEHIVTASAYNNISNHIHIAEENQKILKLKNKPF